MIEVIPSEKLVSLEKFISSFSKTSAVSFMTLLLYDIVYPITRRQILDSSKLKEFADSNFKFDKKGRMLCKQVENTVGKGEIARYEQFLLLPTVFSKDLFPRGVKRCHCVEMGYLIH